MEEGKNWSVVRVAAEGAPIRRAVAILEREAPSMQSALRRAFGFLARRGLSFGLPQVRAAGLDDALAGLDAPTFRMDVRIEPGGSIGHVVIDAGAASLILDGVLGGDGSSLPVLSPAGLSAAQRALVSRVMGTVVSSLNDAFFPTLGLTLTAVPQSPDERPDEGTPLVCTFALEGAPAPATIVLSLAKDAVLSRAKSHAKAPPARDPRVAAVLEGVEIEVVAELGSERKSFVDIANLKVGDTLRLDIALQQPVKVRAGKRILFVGQPTAIGRQVAIRFERWHGDWKP